MIKAQNAYIFLLHWSSIQCKRFASLKIPFFLFPIDTKYFLPSSHQKLGEWMINNWIIIYDESTLKDDLIKLLLKIR